MEDERTGTWRLSRVIGNNAAKVYLMDRLCGHTAPYPNEFSTKDLRALFGEEKSGRNWHITHLIQHQNNCLLKIYTGWCIRIAERFSISPTLSI